MTMPNATSEIIDAINVDYPTCRTCGAQLRFTSMPDDDFTPNEWSNHFAQCRAASDELKQKGSLKDPSQMILAVAYEYRNAVLCDACHRKGLEFNQRSKTQSSIDRLRRHIYDSGLLPSMAADATFEKASQPNIQRNPGIWLVAGDWHKHNQNVWICGPSGSGKSFLAWCIANRFIEHQISVAQLTGPDACSLALRFDWQERLRPYERATLLIIDDIDKGVWNEREYNVLFSLLNKRMAKNHRLIVTGNTTGQHWIDNVKHRHPENLSLADAIRRRMFPGGDMNRMLGWELKGRAEITNE